MRRTCIVIILLLAGASVVTARVKASPPSREGIRAASRLVPGDYLAKSYIAKVAQARSVSKVDPADEPIFARVTEDDDGNEVIFGNFQRDLGQLNLRRDGALTALDADAPKGSYSLTLSGQTSFSLTYAEFAGVEFTQVGDSGEYLAWRILGGRYVDPMGRKYAFNPRGYAIFAGRQTFYRIPVDEESMPEDSLVIDGVVYTFETDGGALRIFRIPEAAEPSAPKEPKWSMRRILGSKVPQ